MAERKPIAILADDEEQYLLPYGAFLEGLGYKVLKAKNKQELLALAAGGCVLVVDACLPTLEMEGIEAVGELLREHQLRSNVAVIFISGYREDTPMVREKLQGYPALQGRCRWVWKDEEFEILSDAIAEELARLS